MSDTPPATDFGDADPEDAWDDGDSFAVKVAILRRVISELRERRDDPRTEVRRVDALRLVGKLLAERDEVESIGAELEAL